jgi:hypothetical protein
MKAISKRICKLESQFGLGPETEQLLLVVTAAGSGLALDQDKCIQILRECEFLPTGPVGLVNLGQIPGGLNAEELERFPRKDGADICAQRARRVTAAVGTVYLRPSWQTLVSRGAI